MAIPEDPTPQTKRYGDQYPPSRPSWATYIVAALAIAGVTAILNWAQYQASFNFRN
jgi:hypothetical protein